MIFIKCEDICVSVHQDNTTRSKTQEAVASLKTIQIVYALLSLHTIGVGLKTFLHTVMWRLY